MDTRLTAPRKEQALETTVRKEIEALRHMTVGQLKLKYAEVFGEETRSSHKQFLFRRIAWRIQALAEGGLSERARRRALEIANDADLRVRAPKTTFQQDFSLSSGNAVKGRVAAKADPRLPAPGGFVERRYKGRNIVVKVREEGFEYEGQLYKSLSAIAREVTGTKWNGFLFFGCAANNGGVNEER
jgi:hypothetical protein